MQVWKTSAAVATKALMDNNNLHDADDGLIQSVDDNSDDTIHSPNNVKKLHTLATIVLQNKSRSASKDDDDTITTTIPRITSHPHIKISRQQETYTG